jgi:hypothetical protein
MLCVRDGYIIVRVFVATSISLARTIRGMTDSFLTLILYMTKEALMLPSRGVMGVAMESQPTPLNREETRLKMRLSRLLAPHVEVSDEELVDRDFVQAVVGRFFSAYPR